MIYFFSIEMICSNVDDDEIVKVRERERERYLLTTRNKVVDRNRQAGR